MGRRKIKIEKIACKDRLKVTFSKRRIGIIKKAQQFSQLTGGTVSLLVFSPGGKPFTFSSDGNFDQAVASVLGSFGESTPQPQEFDSTSALGRLADSALQLQVSDPSYALAQVAEPTSVSATQLQGSESTSAMGQVQEYTSQLQVSRNSGGSVPKPPILHLHV